MRLLLLADLHLGARLPGWGDHAAARREAIRAAWRDSVSTALQATPSIDAVLVAGDLFDLPDPGPADLDPVHEGLERLSEAGKPVVLLPGTYDGFASPRSVYHATLPKGTWVVDRGEPTRISVPAGAETLHLYSFALVPGWTPADPFSLLRREQGEGFHVGLVAASLEKGSSAWSVPRVDADEVGATGLDALVMGGGHNYMETRIGSTLAVDPGTPVGLSFEEAGDRYEVILELGERIEVMKAVRRTSPPVADVSIDCEKVRDEAALAKVVLEQVQGAAAARVRLTGSTERLWNEGLLRERLALEIPVSIEDETLLVPGTETYRALGGKQSAPAQFLSEILDRRAKAHDDATRRVINRAMILGLRELLAAGRSHVG